MYEYLFNFFHVMNGSLDASTDEHREMLLLLLFSDSAYYITTIIIYMHMSVIF